MKNLYFLLLLLATFVSNAQVTGSTPYMTKFGINQVDKDSGANWKITNTDIYDMIIAIVDVYDEVVAHAYIKKNESYMFKDLPIGSYSYKFKSGSKFFENKKLTKFDGCDPEVYVCDGGPQWTMNVWVERSSNSIGVSGKISEDEFFEN